MHYERFPFFKPFGLGLVVRSGSEKDSVEENGSELCLIGWNYYKTMYLGLKSSIQLRMAIENE
jgi:hypothetical protein